MSEKIVAKCVGGIDGEDFVATFSIDLDDVGRAVLSVDGNDIQFDTMQLSQAVAGLSQKAQAFAREAVARRAAKDSAS